MKNRGATLIEILIYTFLSITLILILTDIFSTLLDKSQESVSYSEVEIDGKFINQKLFNQVGNANAISMPANLNESGNNLSFSIDGENYSYYLSGSNLMLNDGVNIERLNGYGTEISDFSVTRLGNTGGKPMVKINYTVTSTILRPGGGEERNIGLSVGTR